MEIKIKGNKEWLFTDPHKVPKALKDKYPEAHWRFIGLSSSQVRRRLDEGYQFVPLRECDGLEKKLTPLAEKIGIPKDVYLVGDTVLMVIHKQDAKMKEKYIDDAIKAKTQNLKKEAIAGIKDLSGGIAVTDKSVTKEEQKYKDKE